jgi:hypothetical protein
MFGTQQQYVIGQQQQQGEHAPHGFAQTRCSQ